MSPSNRPRSTRLPDTPLIEIFPSDTFVEVVRSLCVFIEATVELPLTYTELKTGIGIQILGPLTQFLTHQCEYPYIVSALLALRYHYKDPDDRGLNQARAYACEIIAWRLVLHYSRRERLDALLTELPATDHQRADAVRAEDGEDHGTVDWRDVDERFPLMQARQGSIGIGEDVSFWRRFAAKQTKVSTQGDLAESLDDDPTAPFVGLNALEIAAVADAKRFLSQRVVQQQINAVWNGDIMFWGSVSLHARRKACFFDRATMDPFCRLRVPKYQKSFEAAFFVGLLVLYYVVMQEDNATNVTAAEAILYVWIAAFTYEELSTFWETGSTFYAVDLWNLMDIAIAIVSVAFIVTRLVGLVSGRAEVVNIGFDILSLLAIPLLPRTFSLLSLHPYFGTLIPSLTAMTKDLMKFLVIVLILYAGFASTFVLLARNQFQAKQIMWLLVYIFNGSGYLGLDISTKISRELGPTLMVIFVCITNILLLPTLISLLTNSLTIVMGNAREEFLFQYSILVLESCASKRLTYYFPPLNLIPLILLRPLRVALPASTIRSARIVLLKATHAPFLALILLYERLSGRWNGGQDRWRPKASGSKALGLPQRLGRSQTLLDDPAQDARTAGQQAEGRLGAAGPSDHETADLARLVEDLQGQIHRLELKLEARE